MTILTNGVKVFNKFIYKKNIIRIQIKQFKKINTQHST